MPMESMPSVLFDILSDFRSTIYISQWSCTFRILFR